MVKVEVSGGMGWSQPLAPSWSTGFAEAASLADLGYLSCKEDHNPWLYYSVGLLRRPHDVLGMELLYKM